MITVYTKILLFIAILASAFMWAAKHRGIISQDKAKRFLLTLGILCLSIPLRLPLFALGPEFTGAFGNIIYIDAWYLVILALLLTKGPRDSVAGQSIIEKWLIILLLLAFLSIFNPSNTNIDGTIVGCYYLIWLLISIYTLRIKLELEHIFYSLWTAFRIITIVEFVLALAYPVLNIQAVVVPFIGESATFWADRGGRASAIGTYGHPGNLGLIMCIIFSFFLSNFLNGIHKKSSIIFILLSAATVVLTKSRTSIALLVVVFGMIHAFSNLNRRRRFIIILGLYVFVLPIFVFVALNLSGFLNSLFVSGNLEVMAFARWVHWNLGWKMFIEHPILGVGFNSHLTYLSHHHITVPELKQAWQYHFFYTNPIHNTHLIILSELGLAGGLVWLAGFWWAIKYFPRVIKFAQRSNEMEAMVIALTGASTLLIYFIVAFTDWVTLHRDVLALVGLMLVGSIKANTYNKNAKLALIYRFKLLTTRT